MDCTQLGRSGLSVSRLVLGTKPCLPTGRWPNDSRLSALHLRRQARAGSARLVNTSLRIERQHLVHA